MTVELNSFLVCCSIQCYHLQRIRLYSAGFYLNKWVIFFLTTMVFFQTQPKSNVFSYKRTRPTFVLVWHLSQSDVCTSSTFVPVRRLYQFDVCTSPTFVLSDLCNVRRLWVRRLYCYLQYTWKGCNADNIFCVHPVWNTEEQRKTIGMFLSYWYFGFYLI